MYGVLGIRTLGAAEWNAAQHSCTYQRHESAQSEFDVATIINLTRWYHSCSLLFWNGLGLQGSNKLKSYIMFQKRNIFIISERWRCLSKTDQAYFYSLADMGTSWVWFYLTKESFLVNTLMKLKLMAWFACALTNANVLIN